MNRLNISRIGIGLFYLVSSFFNLFHTMNNTQYLWIVCLENVRFSFQTQFLEKIVIPNEKFIVLLIVIFEIIVGLFILSKGLFVKIGLILGIFWVLSIATFLPLDDILGHIGLGVLHALLLMGNYDTTFWEIIKSIKKIQKSDYSRITYL